MSDLFGIRNQLYLGNFQQVVTEASTFNARGDAQAKVEAETLLHRAYIALGNHFLVLQKIKPDDPVQLQAVKLLATYMQAPEQIETVQGQLNQFMMDASAASDPTLLIVAAMILNREGKYDEALKYIHTASTLEMMAVLVHTYLKMDRLDLAEKQFKIMQQNEDDATLTQLAAAWVNLAKGGDKVQEALFIFVDLAEKYGQSVTLLNGMAAAYMSKGEFEDAAQHLQEALSKNPNDVDSLINMIVCLQHHNVSEDQETTIMSQLRTLHPSHPFVKNLANMEDSFARVAGC
jgi:coatomer protein complex subunit epsilon